MPQVRPTHIDLASILAEPTPSVDLRLHAYEASTSNFLRAVTNYANRAVAEITKHRNAQEADKKRLAEKTVAVKAETNQCKVKEIELLAGTWLCVSWCNYAAVTSLSNGKGKGGGPRSRNINYRSETPARVYPRNLPDRGCRNRAVSCSDCQFKAR
jgi:hypothetical protein